MVRQRLCISEVKEDDKTQLPDTVVEEEARR